MRLAMHRFQFNPSFVYLCLCVYARECDISYVCKFMHVYAHGCRSLICSVAQELNQQRTGSLITPNTTTLFIQTSIHTHTFTFLSGIFIQCNERKPWVYCTMCTCVFECVCIHTCLHCQQSENRLNDNGAVYVGSSCM